MSTINFLLWDAVRGENLRFLEDFIDENKHKLNLNYGDEDGITCVHIAAGLENVEILKCLLSHGASGDCQTLEGLTPLHIAAMWGRSEQVATLLTHGVDCSLVDSSDCDALTYAANSQEDGSQECFESDLILSHQSELVNECSGNSQNVRLTPGSGNDFESLDTSPLVTPRRTSRKERTKYDLLSDHREDEGRTTPESEIDFESLNSSPWITPRRGSRSSRRHKNSSLNETRKFANKRLSTKFENEDSNSLSEDHDANSVEMHFSQNENFEELLTELSSGLLSSSGNESSTEPSSPTFSYSTITCLDTQKLQSPESFECSEYKTLHDSELLTECSTSDDFEVVELEQEHDGAIKGECGNSSLASGLLKSNNIEVASDDDTCVYETADEEIGEDVKGRIRIGVFGKGMVDRVQNGNSKEIYGETQKDGEVEFATSNGGDVAREHAKPGSQVKKGKGIQSVDNDKKNRSEVANTNDIRSKIVEEVKQEGIEVHAEHDIEKERNEMLKDKRGGKSESVCDKQRRNTKKNIGNRDMGQNTTYSVENSCNVDKVNVMNEKKICFKEEENGKKNEKMKTGNYGFDSHCSGKLLEYELFNFDKDFNNLSIITPGVEETPTRVKHKNSDNLLNPNANAPGPLLNSTFFVDSPLKPACKPSSNFFIPFENNKPLVHKTNSSKKVADVRRNQIEDTIIYDWRELSIHQRNETMARIPDSYKKISCHELRKKIRDHGQVPGPITEQTKMLYVKKLWKLDKGIGNCVAKDSSPVNHYPIETRLVLLGKGDIPDCSTLEQKMMEEFCKSPKQMHWRDGHEKASFNYLLMDPRVTLDLPQRNRKLSTTEAFRSFVLSVFYVGKGKRSRPYAHLHEAIKYSKTKGNRKINQIWDIWKDGMGVISLHLFQNAISVEAFTREACMLEALGLSQLTNQKRGEYYGLCANLELSKKRKLGIYFLYKAFQIFLQEGERQICKEDI